MITAIIASVRFKLKWKLPDYSIYAVEREQTGNTGYSNPTIIKPWIKF